MNGNQVRQKGTEVLPPISQLYSSTPDCAVPETAMLEAGLAQAREAKNPKRHFRQFLDHVWQARPSLFCSKSD